jgi:hypothetical protein
MNYLTVVRKRQALVDIARSVLLRHCIDASRPMQRCSAPVAAG